MFSSWIKETDLALKCSGTWNSNGCIQAIISEPRFSHKKEDCEKRKQPKNKKFENFLALIIKDGPKQVMINNIPKVMIINIPKVIMTEKPIQSET